MANVIGMVKSTVTGGVLFLLPVLIVIILLSKGLEIAQRLAQPVVTAIGIETVAGFALGTVVSIFAMLIVAFLTGLLARTKLGQKVLSSFEHSVLGTLPQFKMTHDLVQSLDPQSHQDVKIVLVPTDAGWTLGIVFDPPDDDWWSVFLPGAPQWTSGSIVYAHTDQVHMTGISFPQAIMLMRKCGAESASIRTLLSKLHQKKEL